MIRASNFARSDIHRCLAFQHLAGSGTSSESCAASVGCCRIVFCCLQPPLVEVLANARQLSSLRWIVSHQVIEGNELCIDDFCSFVIGLKKDRSAGELEATKARFHIEG